MIDHEKNYLEVIATIIIAIDKEGMITFLNKVGYEILGYEEGELIGKNWFEICIPNNIRNEVFNVFKSLMKGEIIPEKYYENPIITKSGEEKIVYWINTVLKDVEGEIIGILSSGEDITEKKKEEIKIQKINRSFKMLSKSNLLLSTTESELELFQKLCTTIVETGGYRLAWVGLVKHDLEKTVLPVAQSGFEDGYLENVNITWEDTERGQGPTGTCIRTKTYCMAKNILKDPKFKPWRQQALKCGYNSSISIPIIIEDMVIGAVNIYSAEISAFDQQEVDLLLDMTKNLSHAIEKKRYRNSTHDKIKKEREYFMTIFSAFEDGVYIVNEQEDIQYVNPFLVEEFGNWEGKKCYSYFHGREETCPWCKNQQVFAGETVQWEWYSARNGKTYDLLDTLLINPDGTKSKLEVFRDISDRKKAEKLNLEFNKQLKEEVKNKTRKLTEIFEDQKLYQEQLLKSSQFKSEFMASMSHELRTPLNSIIGFTDVVLERISGEINEEQEEYLTNVKTSAMHLLDLINDVLNIAKIESGKLEMDIQDVNLSNVFSQIDTMLKPHYQKKNLKFEIPIIDKEKTVRVDRLRFKEILFNLLNNAVKYTKEGFIKLVFSESETYWKFDVIDTGIGIKEDDFDLLFKDFKRIKSEYVASIEGTGLGLSLTKKLVGLHGGKISFRSEFGIGSTFTFTIPK
ncbi:MAG: ATP-binding protein [Promethearchaeota archaeon]